MLRAPVKNRRQSSDDESGRLRPPSDDELRIAASARRAPQRFACCGWKLTSLVRDAAGDTKRAEVFEVVGAETRFEVSDHARRVVRREREADLRLAIRLHRLSELAVGQLSEVLMSENEAEPVTARLRERLRQALRQVAELVELIDETEERRPAPRRAEALRGLPQTVGDDRADQTRRVDAEHALRQRAEENLSFSDDPFEVGRLRLAEHVAKLALRKERTELVRKRRKRLLALAGRELVPLAPELRERDRIPDDITAPLRRISHEFEHLGQRGCRFALATAGEERRERRAEDVLRARTQNRVKRRRKIPVKASTCRSASSVRHPSRLNAGG